MLKRLVKALTPPALARAWSATVGSAALSPQQKCRERVKTQLRDIRDGRIPPGTPVELAGQTFHFTDGKAFSSLYIEYFIKQCCRFETDTETPLIIDCGANIGIVSRYFKSIHPKARILAYEPEPEIFSVLQRNCAGLTDVTLERAAVWTRDGLTDFNPQGSLGGHLVELGGGARPEGLREVRTVRLAEQLDRPVDFLKMDIEGAEIEVLQDCADRLGNVRRMLVELHSFSGQPQRIGDTISLIEAAGFRIHAHGCMEEQQPFITSSTFNNKDFRLNLFCTRP